MVAIQTGAKARRSTAAVVRPNGYVCTALAVVALLAVVPSFVQTAAAQSLVLRQTIELPSVEGRIDHMDVDIDGGRLFVAALGADSLEVIDLRAAMRVARLQPMHEPQGVVFQADARRLFVANGRAGNVQAFADGKAPAVASLADLDDADNLRFDSLENQLYVGYAHALAVVDAKTLRVVKRIELPGHPEGFQLDGARRLIYVNVPSARQIVSVDRRSGQIAATWDLSGSSQNFPMTLDEQGHRLLIATRRPSTLLARDTVSGKLVADLSTCGDADDLFFDNMRHQLYVVCGEGLIQVIRQRDADHYEVVEQVATAPGARTGLFVSSTSTLYVAVPKRGAAPAEIRVFQIR